ncbi:MAG: 4Fe-4S dicluster domain-containing protein [Desulfovibrio sp.]|nr:4Fe-4S dicluster domain-containing protein [Desulfovibrio sp.]
MDQDSLRAFEARCTQESPPRCRTACPFDLDCRAFLARLAEGRTAEARKFLERHVPLPGVMALLCDHPCEDACLRRDLGGAIALRRLELFCMLSCGSQERPLPLPAKRFRMAVLGAGLAGLAAAWDLARKAYPVTLFYEKEPTHRLLTRYPQLGRGLSAGDLLAEDMAALTRRKVELVREDFRGALLRSLSADFDAVLLDADAAGALAPDEATIDAASLLWRDNIVCAGWPRTTPTGHACASPSRQAGQGRYAAQTMERLAAHLSLTAERAKALGPLHVDVAGVVPVARVEPAGDSQYSAEEASAEAGRCLQCECLLCVRQCAYLQKFKGYPRIFARQVHNNAAIVKGLHTANALVNGCALCGRCEELCPENFSMAELCLTAREDMVARGTMPPSAHEFALEDMESASGPECALTLPDPAVSGAHSWLFFPGCQLAASRGTQVAVLLNWLRDSLNSGSAPGVALLLSCCGIPARWAGRQEKFKQHTDALRSTWAALGRPRILTACASCLMAFREGLPEAQTLSVWEVMDGLDLSGLTAQAPDSAPRAALPAVFSIHDPCTARHDAAWLSAVRSLARKSGAVVEDPPYSGAATACCGYGGLVWCAQPATAGAMAAHRAAQMPHPGLTSCIMCRDRFAAGGKECWHLLDVLLPGMAGTGSEPGPGLSARRANRAALRARLLAQNGISVPAPTPCRLTVPPDLLARLEERHILLSDVQSAVAGAEASGHWFENAENGHRLGSWRPRNVTFWVDYSPEGEGYALHDAWCHRMIVPGSGGHEAETVIKNQQCCTDGTRKGVA